MNAASLTSIIKDLAIRRGFEQCGIARAEMLDDDARRLESWLLKGHHGSMGYMERNFDMRVDPRKLVPGAKSVITLLKNYYPPVQQEEPSISKYAYGSDYHTVIKDALKQMIHEIKDVVGDFVCRGFVDSAPVLERTWALKSGLGWIGRNGNLITKGGGSFFFIATLICDLELEADQPFGSDFCGTCNRCVTACPTQAILPDKSINGSQCISYFTIELKEEIIPSEMKGRFNNWMFGCDTCQDVCPWNRFSEAHSEPAFAPMTELFDMKEEEWDTISEESFKRIFKKSPISRAGLKGIRRNLKFLKDDANL